MVGHEATVRVGIMTMAAKAKCADKFGRIVVPTELIQVIQGDRKYQRRRKAMPGYIFVEMDLAPITHSIVKRAPRSFGFTSGRFSETPRPLTQAEVDELTVERSCFASFNPGARVQVIDGPWKGTIATVVAQDGRAVTVDVATLGRLVRQSFDVASLTEPRE
jgi:transcriptional antiterminator NusG